MTTTEAPKRQLWELQSMQAAPLSVKIALTKDRIREWVNQYGEDGVYVSFSGGKDSTVLLTIAREMFPSIKGVYVDTGLEYPEVRNFVRTWDNVEWLKPKLTFKQVIEKYGYPFISKEVSERVYYAQRYLTWLKQQETLDRPTDRPTDCVRHDRIAWAENQRQSQEGESDNGDYPLCRFETGNRSRGTRGVQIQGTVGNK